MLNLKKNSGSKRLITEVDHRDVTAGLNFRYSVKDFVTVNDDVV